MKPLRKVARTDEEKAIVEVCQMDLRSGRRLPPRVVPPAANQASTSRPQERTSRREEEQVKYEILAHLKKIPSLLSVYDALKMSPELRQSLIYALSNPEDFSDEVQGETTNRGKKRQSSNSTEQCLTVVTFDDSDFQAETADHNRPLFITGKIGGEEVYRVMVDGGSAINLMPKRMLAQLGIRVSRLQPSHYIIQGFNQNEQRPLGKIRLKTSDIKQYTLPRHRCRYILQRSSWSSLDARSSHCAIHLPPMRQIPVDR